MAIPGFQSLMLPLLKFAGDGAEHTVREAIEALAEQYRLTEEERKEPRSSAPEPIFDNRVGWARTYLTKAVLLETTGRGRFQITDRGQEILRTNPPEINSKFLRKFPEFREFLDGKATEATEEEQREEQTQTPEEELESIYLSLRKDLAHDLLDRIMSCSPRFFERLVVDLLVAMGYGGSWKDAGQAVGQSGDGGIDGIIKEDRLGLDVVYIQAKRWNAVVGSPVVQAFAGSLDGVKARKGILITTSQFTKDAKEYVSRIEKKIVLIDGEQLGQYLIDHGIGVHEAATYTIKRVDLEYFSEEV